jgi:hypothetical protein
VLRIVDPSFARSKIHKLLLLAVAIGVTCLGARPTHATPTPDGLCILNAQDGYFYGFVVDDFLFSSAIALNYAKLELGKTLCVQNGRLVEAAVNHEIVLHPKANNIFATLENFDRAQLGRYLGPGHFDPAAVERDFSLPYQVGYVRLKKPLKSDYIFDPSATVAESVALHQFLKPNAESVNLLDDRGAFNNHSADQFGIRVGFLGWWPEHEMFVAGGATAADSNIYLDYDTPDPVGTGGPLAIETPDGKHLVVGISQIRAVNEDVYFKTNDRKPRYRRPVYHSLSKVIHEWLASDHPNLFHSALAKHHCEEQSRIDARFKR